jgi:CHASE3 domain sensor protein
MYLDTVVISGLIIVALCCVMMVYVTYYAYKHISNDIKRVSSSVEDASTPE